MDQEIKNNFNKVQKAIENAANECGRNPESVKLVAVSKTVAAQRVKMAVEAGAKILGENYIQESREKIQELESLEVSWHFIGRLQSNKAKYAVRLFSLIHSVDSIKLAREIDKCAGKTNKIQDILMQVNLSGEITKAGTDTAQAISLAREMAELKNIRLCGLMTMPPFFDDPVRARPFFARLRELRDEIAALNISGVEMNELSMGMTGDFREAIKEGATLVRVGTAIFGKRQY